MKKTLWKAALAAVVLGVVGSAIIARAGGTIYGAYLYQDSGWDHWTLYAQGTNITWFTNGQPAANVTNVFYVTFPTGSYSNNSGAYVYGGTNYYPSYIVIEPNGSNSIYNTY